uniref:Uncharacterized protein n=1 Tax=Desertifilum tharense IPPAS B-1220 TaxID=1781255 RepID=A0ACD5GPH9_9CYAN
MGDANRGGIALRPAQQIVKNTSADIALAAALINAALSTEVQTAMAAVLTISCPPIAMFPYRAC